MAFINSIVFLLGLGVVAYILVWLFFKFPGDTGKIGELSEIDKDLLKTKKEADIHRLKPFILALSLFVVSVYIFKLITFKEKREFIVIEKAKRTYHTDGNELDIPEIDIPDPEPPKPEVVFKPKVVQNEVEIAAPEKKALELDDLFSDDDEDLKEKPKEKDDLPKGPITTDDPTILPEYANDGETGLKNKLTLELESDFKKFDPGFYVIPLQFVVNVDGSLSDIKIAPDGEVEIPEMAKLVIAGLKKIGTKGAFTTGKKDGQDVRVIIEWPFTIEMQ